MLGMIIVFNFVLIFYLFNSVFVVIFLFKFNNYGVILFSFRDKFLE